MLKLHNFDRSPFGWKVRIVLAEKKVPYETVVPENKNEDPAFARLNPFKMTPVLQLEDGRTIWESTVVNEYLEDVFPTPAMLPRDPYERARVRMLEDSTDQYLYAALRGLTTSQYEYAPPYLIRKKADQVDKKLLEESRTKVHENLVRLEGELKGRTWFGGEILSLADATLVPPLTGSLHLHGILPDSKYPNISSWTSRVRERASYKASEPTQPLTIKD